MAETVTIDQILDGMVTALGSLKPAVGQPLTTTQYVRSIGRYMGAPSINELLQDGAAGRTPALQIAYDSARTLRTTIGRRVDRVEGTFIVFAITDIKSTRDARSVLIKLAGDVRQQLGDRRLSLPIKPLRWVSDRIRFDTEQAIVQEVQFKSEFRIDYTKTATNYDDMLTAFGEIRVPDDADGLPGPVLGEIGAVLR